MSAIKRAIGRLLLAALLSLTSTVLAAEHDRLYPALQQAVRRNGRLYGVPASLRVRCWAYQPERWQRALPDVPPPQTIEAWTALCRAWLREGPMMYPPDVLLEVLCADMLHLYFPQFDQPGRRSPLTRRLSGTCWRSWTA